MTPELRARIRRIQERLDERGLQSVHFNIQAGPTCPPSHVIEDVCEAMEMYLDGRYRKLMLGDSQRAAATPAPAGEQS